MGVQELARIGMKESEMREIASFIRRVVIEEEDETKIKEEIMELRKDFQRVQYCFGGKGKGAYKFIEAFEEE